MPKFQEEVKNLLKAIVGTRFKGLTKKGILKELLINGIALLVTLSISSGVHGALSGFIREKNNKDRLKETVHYEELRERSGFLKKIDRKERDERIVLEKDEISDLEEWVSGFVVFVLGLFIFTYVEAVLERYFEIRELGAS